MKARGGASYYSFVVLISSILMTVFMGNRVAVVSSQEIDIPEPVELISSCNPIDSIVTGSTGVDFREFFFEDELCLAISEMLRLKPEGIFDGEHYAIASVATYFEWRLISLHTLEETSDGPLPSTTANIIARLSEDHEWELGLEGTEQFSQLLANTPVEWIPHSNKKYLDPLHPEFGLLSSNDTEYKFPWPMGDWQYWNGFGHGGATNAIDVGRSQDPNADRRVLAAAGGVIQYVCDNPSNESANVRIMHDDGKVLDYWHLDRSTLREVVKQGNRVERGRVLGLIKTGGWAWDGCGTTSQTSTSSHLHWVLPSDPITVDGWTIDHPDSTWRKGSESRTPGYPYDLLPSTNVPNEGETGNCNPSADQIALFVQTGFDSNSQCVKKDIGQYPNPGSIGLPNDSIKSIKVGANVKALLCVDNDYKGNCAWFESDNGDLNGSSVGYGTSSVKVEVKTPPNDCNPSSNEIALFVQTGFDSNSQCVKKGIGQYPNPASIGLPNDSIKSIKVGGNVRAYLCVDDNYGGNCAWFESDNGDLNGSSVGYGTSSVKVEIRSSVNKPSPVSPPNGAVFNRTDNVSMSWTASNVYDYYAELTGGPGINLTSGWTTSSTWGVGQLWGGTYQWHVRSGDGAGGMSEWSDMRNFTVKYGSPSNLSAVGSSSWTIDLSWNASADAPGNIDGYRIYRNGSAVGVVSNSITSYQDSGLDCASQYSYTVKAYKGSLESDPSSPDLDYTYACAPSYNPEIYPIENYDQDGSYEVSWSYVEIAIFELKEQFNGGTWVTVYDSIMPSQTFSNKANGLWCYQVRAYTAGGSSQWSKVVCTNVSTGSRDSTTDVFWYAPGAATDMLYLANSDGTFQSVAQDVKGAYTPLMGDYDGDGATDIFWYGPGAGYDILYLSNQDGTFRTAAQSVKGVYTPLVGDYNGDGADDIFWYAPGTANDSLYLSTKDGKFQLVGQSVKGTYMPLVGDYDGDGSADIFWYGPGAGYDILYLSNQNGTFRTVAQSVKGTYTPLVGDYDDDGAHDIFWYGPGTANDVLYLSNRNGTFGLVGQSVKGTYTPLVGDYDGDGADDIFWFGPGNVNDALYLSNRNGTFRLVSQGVNGAYTPLVGDYDGDGAGDIFWYGPGTANDALYLSNKDGTFRLLGQSVGGFYTPLVGKFD